MSNRSCVFAVALLSAGGVIHNVQGTIIDSIELTESADSRQGLHIALSDGTAVRGVVDRIEAGAVSDFVYRGRLSGEPRSWFILAVRNGVMMGELSGSTGHYCIRYAGDGRHELQRVDSSERLRCDNGPQQAIENSRLDDVVSNANHYRIGAGTILVDVMVVYTPSSRAVIGGTDATEALIDSMIAYTNMAYEQSGVLHRFRLVLAREVDYVESGSSNEDLVRLRAVNDGHMDEVHDWRDEYGADLVSLINTSGSAGVGYLMNILSPAFAESAFSAIGANTNPIPGGLVLAHETGHNMGCDHNNTPSAPGGILCYSFGYRTPDEQWRTIMSSSPGTFVDFFSTPDVEFDGQPLGISGDGCPSNAAHNARSLNEAAAVVASFRPATIPCGADADCDGDVDLFDFESMQDCSTGPGGNAEGDCLTFDFDGDLDVDRADEAIMQVAFTG